MYIEPSTNIRVLKNVPLDTTYDHTLYFSDAGAQSAYFISKQKYNLTNYTYQRVQRGYARVGIPAESLYDCNYMMFQNTAFGNKWFYAYITSVEYVNNECSEIRFEIDVMQTWFFDYSLDVCFVEREHSLIDTVGSNIMPEPVNCGEYVYNDHTELDVTLIPMSVVIGIVDTDSDGTYTASGSQYDRVYSGLKLFAYPSGNISQINGLLNQYSQKPESVAVMYTCPTKALDGQTGAIRDSFTGVSYDVSLGAIVGNESLDGYAPRNKKLYTYPYNFMQVSTPDGNSLSLRYEFNPQSAITGKIYTTMTQPVSATFKPTNYKGCDIDDCEAITLTNYPQCSWNTDAYGSWYAQNSLTSIVGAIKKADQTVTTAFIQDATGRVSNTTLGEGLLSVADRGTIQGGMIVGALERIGNLMTGTYTASISADIAKGNMASANANVAHNRQTFYQGRMSVTYNMAQAIDKFFDRFGYATNTLAIPNRNGRPHWNYVKTAGCTITGSIPADDARAICHIYDAGITFWNNPSEVGNYELDNSI